MTHEARQSRAVVIARLQGAMTELEWSDYKELIVSLSKTLEEECQRIGATYWNGVAR